MNATMRRRESRCWPVGKEIKRLGERFSLEWIRQVGSEANDIFVPYFTQG